MHIRKAHYKLKFCLKKEKEFDKVDNKNANNIYSNNINLNNNILKDENAKDTCTQ